MVTPEQEQIKRHHTNTTKIIIEKRRWMPSKLSDLTQKSGWIQMPRPVIHVTSLVQPTTAMKQLLTQTSADVSHADLILPRSLT